MSVLQTSLNTPLPATDGQLLIGSTLNFPSVNTLTAGTNIGITNSPGGISIAALGFGSITWQTITTGVNPILPFIGYVVNGIASCQYNSSAQVGFIYILATGTAGSTIGLTSGALNIHYGGNTFTSLSNTTPNASICLVGVGGGFLNVLFSTGTFTGV